ncbi:MAG TPA: LUD domain-containing protein [Streptosporangiaceae bacterium]
MTAARDEVLARIKTALGDRGQPTLLGRAAPAGAAREAADVPRRYRVRGAADPTALLGQLADRLTDYRALVRRVMPGQVAGAAGDALTRRGARRVVVPLGLSLAGLPASELDTMDGVITGAAVAIAETGTIILDGSPSQGRRALSLIPDYHLCLLRADQVVALVPEALARLARGRPLTWISGPSATSDIELERVEGVHGPRTLEVILISPGG